MKSFEDFRNNWITPEKEKELKNASLQQTETLSVSDERSFMATFCATYSLLLLNEYHEWINFPESQS